MKDEDRNLCVELMQVGSLLDEVQCDCQPGASLKDVLEYLAAHKENETEDPVKDTAREVWNNFSCDDFPTHVLAQKALEYLKYKEDNQPKPKRKYTKRKK